MPATEQHTKKRKKLMIEALRKHKALVSYAAKACGVSRTIHYEWLKKDANYNKAVEEIENYVLDKIEDSSMKMIDEGKTPAMNIFYLKCKGKKRGFIEKQEIEISTGDMTSLRNLIRECADEEEYSQEY